MAKIARALGDALHQGGGYKLLQLGYLKTLVFALADYGDYKLL